MSVVQLLHDDRGEVVQSLVRALVVEEVDPFERGDLDMVDVPPGTVAVDLLGLERPDRRLGQGVDAPIVVNS